MEEKLSLGKTETDWLLEKTSNDFKCFNVDAIEILSCFLPSISSDGRREEVDFLHKSQQEVFSALHIYQQMKKKRKTFKEICVDVIKKYEDTSDEKAEEMIAQSWVTRGHGEIGSYNKEERKTQDARLDFYVRYSLKR